MAGMTRRRTTTMTTQDAKNITDQIEAALKPVAEANGLTLIIKGGVVDPSGRFRPSLEFVTADADKVEFARWVDVMQLPKDAFGRTFAYRGQSYRIDGVKPGVKQPVRAMGPNGKRTWFQAEYVRNALAVQA
jgi:hypothetical protein